MLADVAGDRAVLYFGEPIHSRYVLVRRDHLATVTSLAHERWKRAHPRGLPTEGAGGNRNEAVQPTRFYRIFIGWEGPLFSIKCGGESVQACRHQRDQRPDQGGGSWAVIVLLRPRVATLRDCDLLQADHPTGR